jgi:glucose/arabinose dehydrogenase
MTIQRLLLGVVFLVTSSCHAAASSPRAVPVPAEIAAGVTLTRVATGLSKPVLLTYAPGDGDPSRLFVVEKTGTIRLMKNGTIDPQGTPFLDVAKRVSGASEQGLLGLAFHPKFAENGRLYVNFTDRKGDTRVVEFRVAADDPDRVDPKTERQLLFVDQPYSNHNGGHLVFGPDGLLYVGLGDGGWANDPHGHGQNPTSLLGKMLVLDVEAGSLAAPTIVATGLRNPWRYAFDRATGDLWIADVGQNAFEEVHVMTPQQRKAAPPVNFGWNVMEGLHCFRANECDRRPFVLPVVEYDHDDGCSITGGHVYRGKLLPRLSGLYFYADYCTAMVRSLRPRGAGEPVTDIWDWRAALDPENRLANLSSSGEDPAGELYLVSLDGDVYRFDPTARVALPAAR